MPLAPGLTIPAGGRLFHAKIFSKSAGKVPRFSLRAMGGGSAPVPGAVVALVVFLPIIRKQHETDLQITQKRLEIYLKCIDK